MYEPEPLSQTPQAPAVPGTPVIRETPDDVVGSMADDLFNQSLACVRAFGSFQLAVSDAPELEHLYRRLLVDPVYRAMPWGMTHLWVVSCEQSEQIGYDSGAELVRDTLGEHAGIPRSQFHEPEVPSDERDRRASAVAYKREIQECLGWREKGHDRLDAVLLRLDDGGRVSSTGPTDWEKDLVEHSETGVSLSGSILNASRLVLVDCGDSVNGLRSVVRGEAPGAKLKPLAGELRWYISHATCVGATGAS